MLTLQLINLLIPYYQGPGNLVLRDSNGETNSSLGDDEDNEDDVVPGEPDPESIHGKIIASRRNREKFAIKKSYSIEVCMTNLSYFYLRRSRAFLLVARGVVMHAVTWYILHFRLGEMPRKRRAYRATSTSM